MVDDELTVTGHLDVGLKAIGAQCVGRTERGKCVFGGDLLGASVSVNGHDRLCLFLPVRRQIACDTQLGVLLDVKIVEIVIVAVIALRSENLSFIVERCRRSRADDGAARKIDRRVRDTGDGLPHGVEIVRALDFTCGELPPCLCHIHRSAAKAF